MTRNYYIEIQRDIDDAEWTRLNNPYPLKKAAIESYTAKIFTKANVPWRVMEVNTIEEVVYAHGIGL